MELRKPRLTLEVRDRRPYYSPGEVADLARVDPKTVLNWIHQGRLDAVRLSPRIYRIPLAAVIKLLRPEEIKPVRLQLRGPLPRPGRGETWIGGERARSRRGRP
jgi:excisionase family DNA binding protein